MSEEIHKITFKTDYSEQKRAEAEHKAFLEREKADNKIRIENEKRITITKGTESKIRVEQAKTEARLTVLAEQEAIKQRIALARQEAAEKRKSAVNDAKFTGQSTTLGSLGAVTQQLTYYKGLRDNVASTSAEFTKYNQKVNELNASKKQLMGTTAGLTTQVGAFGKGMISLIAIQQAYNTSLNSARFQVMREAFQGSEKDLQALRSAVANTVTDAGLIALSNQASDLNVSLRDQVILFNFAETVADKYGSSTEEGFARVFAVMQGNTKGLRELGITKTEFLKTSEALAKEQGKEVDESVRLQALIKLTNTTYEDSINKTMDLADVHETLKVQVKNVADEHGNFWDVLSSLNPVTGFFNVGLEDMAKKESKAKDDAKLLVGQLDEWNSKVPVWGSATENLRGYFVDLANQFLSTAETAGMLTEALQGTVINRKGGDASIPTQGTSKLKKTGTGSRNTGSSTVKEVQEELNLVKLLQAEQVKLQAQYDKNIGDLGAQNDLRLKMLDIEREIFRLRTGSDISFKTIGEGQTINYKDLFPEMIRPGYKRSGFGGEESTEDYNRRMEEAEAQRLQYAQQINSEFFNILNTTGLINTEFGRIIQMLKAAFDTGSSAIGLIGSIVGFFAGGPVGSVIGGIGGGGALSAGLPGSGSGINRAMNTVRGSSQAPKYDFMVSNTIGGVAKLIIYEDGKAISEKLAVSEL